MTGITKFALLGVAIALAAGSGYLTATAIGITGQTPARTVTIDVGTGPQGPQGPPGPPGERGPAGSFTCPTGFSEADVVFIQQGKGPTELFACVKD